MNRSREEHRRQQRDQDRRDLDQHRGGAGVDPLLALVERDVVDAEPQHADGDDATPGRRASGRGSRAPGPPPPRQQRADHAAGRAMSAPGEKSWPRWRIATNAEAQSTRVTPTAASGSQAGDPVTSEAPVGDCVVVVTRAA